MGRRTAAADAVGMVAGYALDSLLGDPRRWHPVAGFGRAAGALERRVYRADRRAGAVFTAVAVGAPVLLGVAVAGSPGDTRRPGSWSWPPAPGPCSAAGPCAARRR